MEKKGLQLADEEKMLNKKHFGIVGFAFLAYKNVKNVTGDVRGTERSECVMVAARESVELGAAGRLRLEHESNSLLQQLMSRFSQPGDLVVERFAETILTAVACFTVLHHRVLAGCKTDLRCFRVAQ